MERLTYDFCVMNAHCWQVKGADNLECREVCENQEDRGGCKKCPIAKAFDRLAEIENILGDEYDIDRLRELIYIDRERERWLQAAKNGIEKPVMRYALESDGWEFRKLLKENNTTVKRVVELVQADRDGRCVVLPCDNETPSNGDRIRRMSDEELCGTIYAVQKALCIHFAKALGFPIEELKFEEDAPDILERLQQPAKEG